MRSQKLKLSDVIPKPSHVPFLFSGLLSPAFPHPGSAASPSTRSAGVLPHGAILRCLSVFLSPDWACQQPMQSVAQCRTHRWLFCL